MIAAESCLKIKSKMKVERTSVREREREGENLRDDGCRRKRSKNKNYLITNEQSSERVVL